MQRLATQVFVASSIAFGLIGSLFFVGALLAHWDDSTSVTVGAIWGVTGSVVLSSFAVSVAGKYLIDD